LRSEVDGEKALLEDDELFHWQGLVTYFGVDEALYLVSVCLSLQGQETYLIELCSEESPVGEKMIWEEVSHRFKKRLHPAKLV
jgi:hypothetical protein